MFERLDSLLKPLGFTRRRHVWNRRDGILVSVVDVQVSKAGDTATLNAGVLDRDVYLKAWDKEPPAFIEVPECTVSARVGELIDNKDVWWKLAEDDSGNALSQSVVTHLLPFLEHMRGREGMVRWLSDPKVVGKRAPLHNINLAILQHLMGNSSAACVLLAEIEQKAIGAWRTRASEVAGRLGCVP